MHIKKGDQVKIIAGKDRGKTGTVAKVFPEKERVVVDGINMYKKRVRPKRQGEKGESVLIAFPLKASNVMLVCSNCKKPSRVGARKEGEKKMRYCKKCGAVPL